MSIAWFMVMLVIAAVGVPILCTVISRDMGER